MDVTCFCSSLLWFLKLVGPLPGTYQVEYRVWTAPHHYGNRLDFGLETVDCEVSISSNGARREDCTSRFLRHYVEPQAPVTVSTLLQPGSTGYAWGSLRRTVFPMHCDCGRTALPLARFSKATCEEEAKLRLAGDARESSGWIPRWEGGQRVVAWTLPGREDWEYDWEMEFAPQLDCQVMGFRKRLRGLFGLLTGSLETLRVTGFIAGEPDRSRFMLPAGYTVERRRH